MNNRVQILLRYFVLLVSISFTNRAYTQSNTANNKVKIHVIMIGDTEDPSIGESVKSDLSEIEYLFKEFTENHKQLIVNYKTIKGNQFTKNNVLMTLNNLPVGSNDVVFIYSSNHGTKSTGSNFPSIVFSGPNDTLGLQSIQNIVKLKNPRLHIIIGDMCNNVNQTPPRFGSTSFIQMDYELNVNKLYSLFVNANGYILSSSAKPYEYAWSKEGQVGISPIIL